MTTHPSTHDRGVSIQDRLWPLNEAHRAHVEDNFCIPTPASVFLLSLPRTHIGELTAFDAFHRASPMANYMEAMQQGWLKACEKMRRQTEEHFDPTHLSAHKFAFDLFIEAVVAPTESDEQRAKRTNRVESAREHVMRATYGPNVFETTPLPRGGDDGTATPFMYEAQNREVIEYRMWLVVYEVNIDFPTQMYAVMKEARDIVRREAAAQSFGGGDRGGRRGGGAARHSAASAGQTAADATRVSSRVANHERWMLFHSDEAYLEFVRLYLNDEAYSMREVIAHCLDPVHTIAHADNPANARRVFAPTTYFHNGNARHACAEQASYANYFVRMADGRDGFTVPFKSCMLHVPTNKLGVLEFSRMYTPDHQARVIQARLPERYYPRLAKSAKVREQEAALRAAARAAAAASGVEPPSLLTVPGLAPGEPPHQTPLNDDDEVLSMEREFRHIQEDAEVAAAEFEEQGRAVPLSVQYAFEQRSQFLLQERMARSKVNDHTRLPYWPAEHRKVVPDSADPYAPLNVAAQQPLGCFDFGDRTTRASTRALNSMINNHMSTGSAFETLAAHHRDFCTAQLRKTQDPQTRQVLCVWQRSRSFEDYAKSCLSPSSAVSTVQRAINTYLEAAIEQGTNRYIDPPLPFDRRLSTFGRMMGQLMLSEEKVHNIHAAHRESLLVRFTHMDAMRKEYGLHFNLLLVGPNTTSKSYVVEKHQRIAIPGTVTIISHETAKARNTTTNRDDAFDAYHETADAMLLASKTGSGTGDNSAILNPFKERLTSCTMTTMRYGEDAEGQRVTIFETSSQIGSTVMLSNIDTTLIDAAIRSRFWLSVMSQMKREGSTIAERSATEQPIELSTIVVNNERFMQVVFSHVEGAVRSGLIRDVTLTVFSLYIGIIERTLHEEFGISLAPRTARRMCLLTRHLVIMEAAHRLYVVPRAPFRGQPFHIDQLKDIELWLYDFQEVVFFVLGFAVDQYTDVDQELLVDELRVLVDEMTREPSSDAFTDRFVDSVARAERVAQCRALLQPSHRKYRALGSGAAPPEQTLDEVAALLYETVPPDLVDPALLAHAATADADGTGDAAAAAAGAGANGSTVPPLRKLTIATGPPRQTVRIEPPVRRAPSGMRMVDGNGARGCYNWNYVRIGNLKDIAAKTASGLNSRNGRQYEADRIRNKLRAMTRVVVNSQPYKQNEHHGEQGHPLCAWPVVPVGEKAPRMRMNVAKIDEETQLVYIASAMLYGERRNVLNTVIDKCIDFKTHRATYVSGVQFRPDAPHFFKTYEVRPAYKSVRTHTNGATIDRLSRLILFGSATPLGVNDETSVPPWLRSGGYALQTHVDRYSQMMHWHKCDLPLNDVQMNAYSRSVCDAAIVRHPLCDQALLDKRYPEDIYNETNSDARQRTDKAAIDAALPSNVASLPLFKDRVVGSYLRDDYKEDGSDMPHWLNTSRQFATAEQVAAFVEACAAEQKQEREQMCVEETIRAAAVEFAADAAANPQIAASSSTPQSLPLPAPPQKVARPRPIPVDDDDNDYNDKERTEGVATTQAEKRSRRHAKRATTAAQQPVTAPTAAPAAVPSECDYGFTAVAAATTAATADDDDDYDPCALPAN